VHLQNGILKYFNPLDGKYYDQPTRQARYALVMISNYQITHNEAYLHQALLQVNHLLASAVHSRGALYFPFHYLFPRVTAPDGSAMIPPWYSAMAQGRALAALVRLYIVTGNERYAQGAYETFQSFKNLKDDSLPWTVYVNSAGNLWFEEYPLPKP